MFYGRGMHPYWAHHDGGGDESSGHSLEDHLESVARDAAGFAASWRGDRWAFLAGVWHDLGKYRPGFQRYIRQDKDAHIEGKVASADKTHSAAGAVHAIDNFRRRHGKPGATAARLLAQVIAGHHAGLADWESASGAGRDLADRLLAPGGEFSAASQREYSEAAAVAPSSILQADAEFDCIQELLALPGLQSNPIALAFAVRMVFSCLVDADFLDTERFFSEMRSQARADIPTINELCAALEKYFTARDAALREAARATTQVNRIRAEVLAQCRVKARCDPGFFSLEVPTGGGKTLSSLAFALDHAQRHGLQRVIYAIPYTSIIEQTADVFRGVFSELGKAAVIEHHSQVESDPAHETHASRLACENWDAPLVVTTNVQLFESLFAARPSQCRKLHRLAKAVIVLDEAQQLPPRFLQPILDALRLLVECYGSTVVLCTATQPALTSAESFDPRQRLRGLPAPVPIIDRAEDVFAQLSRVKVHFPDDWTSRPELDDLARRVAAHDCALIVVDRKADARALHGLLPDGAFHLSTDMCGAHRADTIAAIRQGLIDRRTGVDRRVLHVVSTQMIEAGVDLDFPVVFRALAGLDSIAQAAGRCNREGLLECGQVFVFNPPKEAPAGLLRKAAQATRSVLEARPLDPLTPEVFRRYFKQLYADCDLDQEGIVELLQTSLRGAGPNIRFRTAAERFRLIESGSVPVIVRYRGGAATDTVAELLGKLAKDGPSRWLLRALQRYSVSLRPARASVLAAQGVIAPAPGLPDWYVQQSDLFYHPALGVDPEGASFDPVAYVV